MKHHGGTVGIIATLKLADPLFNYEIELLTV